MRPPKTERNAAILQGHLAGATQRALAAQFGIDPARVSRILKAERARPRPVGRPRLPAELNTPLYVKARRYFGAREARRIVGVEF